MSHTSSHRGEDTRNRDTKGRSGWTTVGARATAGTRPWLLLVSLLVGLAGQARSQEPSYPPLDEYMMGRGAEVALARSAAPDGVSGRATVKVLTESGYEIAAEGDNGFVCVVLRGWAAAISSTPSERELAYYPGLRAPHCFDPVASRTVLPLQELVAQLAIAGKAPDQIADQVQVAYARGELPELEAVAFAYMFSADQNLGPGVGAWHPHMMVYTPYYHNSMLGGNEMESGLPVVGDSGTQFAVTVIPVDERLAVRARSAQSDQ